MNSIRGSVVVIALMFASSAFAVRYECVDLGAVLQGNARAMALNDTGMVVGSTGINDRAPAYWTAATGMQRLGPGSASLRRGLATGVNDSGLVVGYVDWYMGGSVKNQQPFSWKLGKGYKILETAGSSWSFPQAVNSSGTACGYIATPETACTWDAEGRITLLGRLDPDFGSGATDINDQGEVCGTASTPPMPGYPRAFRWTPSEGMKNLGVLPGYHNSFASAIDNKGTVIGYCWSAFLGYRGFRCESGKAMEDIGGLGMLPEGLNERGQIVGVFAPGSNGVRAMLIEPGIGPIDLNTVTSGIPTGWILDTAYDINERGDIAGMAAVGRNVRAFLLRRVD